MSGGSWGYAYQGIRDVADKLQGQREVNRRVFGKLLGKCADAMKAVEWVDSGDYSYGDEDALIAEALSFGGPGGMATLATLIEDAKEKIAELQKAMEEAKKASEKR